MNAIRHLAQLNIGRFLYPTDDPRMADFTRAERPCVRLGQRSGGAIVEDGALCACQPSSIRSDVREI
jgi:Domain of unknown function (DUF3291)